MDEIKSTSEMDAEKVWNAAIELIGCMVAVADGIDGLMELTTPHLNSETFQNYQKYFVNAFYLMGIKRDELRGLLENVPTKEIRVDGQTTITLGPFNKE